MGGTMIGFCPDVSPRLILHILTLLLCGGSAKGCLTRSRIDVA